MKIITIVGARPQFIKAAAVSREIAKHSDIEEYIIHTGQHFDKNMSEVFFEEMDIPKPNYNLAINNLSHGAMTGRMLEGIEGIILKEKPNWVLLYGDTNSTLAGALAASKSHVKLAHVEAGLRSFNMKMPEEVNRILTDRLSNILFCPTDKAVENLNLEGYDNIDCEVVKVGDVMQDAAMFYATMSKKPSFNIPSQFVLATIHRAENTDDKNRLSSIINAFNNINQDVPVILPLHPRTKKYIEKYQLDVKFQTVDPVGYLEMVYLLQNCKVVMTDSGGLQKEAFFFQKPCITIRDQTEWVELVSNKVNVLSNAEEKDILNKFQLMTNQSYDFNVDLYGNGTASSKIINYIRNFKKEKELNSTTNYIKS